MGEKGGTDGIAVGFDRLFDPFAIAAAHGGDDRESTGAASVKDEAIAAGEPVEGQLELAETVPFVWIDARLVEDDLRPKLVKEEREVRFEKGEVVVVAESVREGQVETALLLLGGKVLFAVHGEGEDVRISLKDRGGPVALVDIAVDDRCAADAAILDLLPRTKRRTFLNILTKLAKLSDEAAAKAERDAKREAKRAARDEKKKKQKPASEPRKRDGARK